MITHYPSSQKLLTAKVPHSTQRTSVAFLSDRCGTFANFAVKSFFRPGERNQPMHNGSLRQIISRTGFIYPILLALYRRFSVLALAVVFAATVAPAQDWIKTGTGLGV